MQILVVEDERRMADLLRADAPAKKAIRWPLARDGREGFEMARCLAV